MPRLKKVLDKAKGKMGQSSEVLPILLNLADDTYLLFGLGFDLAIDNLKHT